MAENYERKIYDAIQKGYITDPNANDDTGGFSPEHTNESLFPTKPKPQGKKQTGATGPTGPPRPLNPQQVFQNNPAAQALNNPALAALGDHIDNLNKNNDWRDRAAAQAEGLQNQFHGPPQMTGYHWHAGSGGLQGGNDAGMTATFSDGTSRFINTSIPGQIPAERLTTQQAQQYMLDDASREGYGGGILPGWNSPTGQNIDLTKFGPKEVDISAAGPTTPSGWLNSAIAAARSGANTYDTGGKGTKVDGNAPVGEIEQGNPFNQTKIATPTGGSIGINTGAGNNDNPFVGERAKLLTAIGQSSNKDNNQYQGGY
jgi:hypothetical protein